MNALIEIIAHLQAAKIQRVPGDDAIIGEHIDAALAAAQRLMAQLARREAA